MRLLGSITSFAFTMFTALFIFAYMLVQTPQTLRWLLDGADSFRSAILSLGLFPDQYSIWIQVLLQANQIVLIGISIAVRIAIAIIMSLFGSSAEPRFPDQIRRTEADTRGGSLFSRWGQRS